jgi:uncharacterized glyoxalase superfamily protein PhnB
MNVARKQARRKPSAKKKTAPKKKATPMKDRRRQTPETLRVQRFAPGFTVDNLQNSVRFYTGALGFIVGEKWTEGGVLRGVTLRAGASELYLSQDDWSKGRDRKKGDGVRVWCETAQDIDALAARIKAAGSTLTQEPANQSWGGRSLSVDDPDGYHLTILRKK